MGRRNIFEKLQENWNIDYEVNCLYRLIESEEAFVRRMVGYTMREFVELYAFGEWKNRRHFLELEDFLDACSYEELTVKAKCDPEAFVDFIEIAFNIYYLAQNSFEETDDEWKYCEAYELFPQIANDCLSQLNHRVFYDEELEQAIIIEDKPEVAAVVEIEGDPEVAYEVIRYNHHTLKGNVSAKKAILLKLGNQLEPVRSELSIRNKALAADIFTMLNNLNIRHNNCSPGNSKYKPYVAAMTSEEIESWYDDLYQMILLAKLELDHTDRIARISELKQKL